MQIKWWIISILCTVISLVSCLNFTKESTLTRIIKELKIELNNASAEVKQLIKLAENSAGIIEVQKQFRKSRSAYKRIEWFAEYYYPFTAKMINGPALDEVEPDEKNIIVKAEGFQVIEEILFDTGNNYLQPELLQQAKILGSNIGRLEYMVTLLETTDAHILDALRLQIFRIITLGISGFDSPVANNSLEEAATSLKSIKHIVSLYQHELITQDNRLMEQLQVDLDRSIQSLSSAKDFNSFNRMIFIIDFMNPASEKILAIQHALKLPRFTEPRFLSAEAPSLFARNIFNADFYTPGVQSYSNPEKIKLGEKLFYDGILSGDGKRSCATCHQLGKAFTDGLATSVAFDGKNNIRRNSPTLINAALQPALFYDMRVSYLEDQAKDVIDNKDEMHGSLQNALLNIAMDDVYKELFVKVYKNEELSELHVKNCIAAYIRSLVTMNARFDLYMRGDHAIMNKMEIDGFNLFAGKAKCATCHFIPLFNGNNPPVFDKIDAEVLGVPATADSLQPVLDSDQGKFNLYRIGLHKNAFKTPTLRNIEFTAPYMHNGVYQTLEDVVAFYNRGGGAGLGLQLDNQTLPEDKLNLTAYEKESLIAFMKTLSDTTFGRN
ncbi:MAG: cytochrome c peroxidase [Chitinophagaceae bacterium]